MVLLVKLVRDTFKAFRKKTIFFLMCMNHLHHVDKRTFCSMSVLKFGWTSTSNDLPVFTAVIKLSAFADDFVKQSAEIFWVEMWARSWILPEQASFRNMEIIWIISFCSRKWIVLAVVTKFFASLLMRISAISPDMSIHNPRKNWHELKYFMNEYKSVTVVESTVLLIFSLSSSTRLPYDIPSFEECSRNSAQKHCHASPWRPIFIVSVGGIKKSNYSQRSCEWPEVKFHWLQLELPHQLVKSFYITNCWRCCTWSTSGKLVTTLELCPAL